MPVQTQGRRNIWDVFRTYTDLDGRRNTEDTPDPTHWYKVVALIQAALWEGKFTEYCTWGTFILISKDNGYVNNWPSGDTMEECDRDPEPPPDVGNSVP